MPGGVGSYSKQGVAAGSSAGGVCFYVCRRGVWEGVCEACGEIDPTPTSIAAGAVVFCRESDASLGWVHGARKCLSKFRWHGVAPTVALHDEIAEPQGQSVLQNLAAARAGPPRSGESPPVLATAFKFPAAWGCDLKRAWRVEEIPVPPAEAQQGKRVLRVHTSEEVEPSVGATAAPRAQPPRSKKNAKVDGQELEAPRPQVEQPDGSRPDVAVEKSGAEAAGEKAACSEKCGGAKTDVVDEEAVCAGGA